MSEFGCAKQLGQSLRWRLLDLTYTIDELGQVHVPRSWERANIVAVALPRGAHARQDNVWCHKHMAPVLAAWFSLIEREQLGGCIQTYNGCFVPRLRRQASRLPSVPDGGTRERAWNKYLSMHSRGAACDFNAALNGQGTNGPPEGTPFDLRPILRLAGLVRVRVAGYSLGLVCGIRWSPKYRDPMHVELGWFPG